MGGNVVVLDASGKQQVAGKADFRKLKRDDFVRSFLAFFKRLDALYENEMGESLWPANRLGGLISSGVIFSGSSSHLFNKNLTDEEFVNHKPVVGDIDITIPKEKLENLHQLLDSIRGRQITSDISLVGQKPSVSHEQINAIFSYIYDAELPPLNIQVDFEAVGYEKGQPSEFVKFARSSDWTDVKGGVKGVFHKYLLRCLASVLSRQEDVVLLTPMSPLSPPEKVKVSKVTEPLHLLSFSVDRGLRTSAQQQFLPDGSPLLVGGKKAFKKTPPTTATYYQSKSDIFSLIFGSEPVGNEVSLFASFGGVLQLMQDHLSNDQIEEVYLDFIGNKLYGKSGQALDAYDSQSDMQAKLSAISAFKKKFPFLSSHDGLLNQLVEDYYKNYKTRVAEGTRRTRRVIDA
jgi:hypothetical protein